MRPINRRDMLKSTCGIGALLALPAGELLAQGQQFRFTQLRLGGQGQAQLNPLVSAMDSHEDRLIDDLLGNDQNGERQDLGSIDQDIDGLLNNPGNAINLDQGAFRQDGMIIHDRIGRTLDGGLDQRVIFGVVQLIDFFVGHWYPCNDIYEVSVCEQKVWNSINAGNLHVAEFYCCHMQFEMDAMFRFHRRRGDFVRQTNGLLGVLGRVQGMARQNDARGCRQEFMRFTMATDLIYRRHYPEWCAA